MEQRFILDTNPLIYYTKDELPVKASDFLEEQMSQGLYLSVISKIELLGWVFPTEASEELMKKLINGFVVVKLRYPIVNKTIDIRKTYKIKLPDAIIAATALVHDLTLISRNDSDFKRIAGLKYLNPFTDL
jgi:predicted nucleic acid-binding protein